MSNLWRNSLTLEPIISRVEKGGWIVKDINGAYSIVPVDLPAYACGMTPPSNFLDEMPAGTVGFIHTHPFFEGENTKVVCGEGGSDSYQSGTNTDDYNLLLAIAERTGNPNVVGYNMDGSNIVRTNVLYNNTYYSRCNY